MQKLTKKNRVRIYNLVRLLTKKHVLYSVFEIKK